MSYNKLAVEVQDSTQTWQDRTGDLMKATWIKAEGVQYGKNVPTASQVNFIFLNQSQTYTDLTKIEIGYRIRLKATGRSLAKALSIQHSGATANDLSGFKQQPSVVIGIGEIWTLQ